MRARDRLRRLPATLAATLLACSPAIVEGDQGGDAGSDAGAADSDGEPADGAEGGACLAGRACDGELGCNLANVCVTCGDGGLPSISELSASSAGVCWTADAEFCDLVLDPSDGSGQASSSRQLALDDQCVPILINEPYDVSLKCYRGECLVIARTETG